jgi:AraC-like DNA-binding protein
MHEMLIVNQHLEDLNPVLFGRMKCAPTQCREPVVLDYVLIHYVESGRGTLYRNGRAYPVHKGQAFIIINGELASYATDPSDPWEYRWIAFTGRLSGKYGTLPPVIEMEDSLFPNAFEHQDGFTELLLASQLFKMTAELFAEEKNINHHVQKVKNYIKQSYMNDVRIERIAKSLSLDRHYLSRIFKKETGLSIQDYLVQERMKRACALLSEGRSITESASLCGYADLCNFSKMFKRIYGISPSDYRKSKLSAKA